MALAIDNAIRYWRVRLRQGPAAEFLRWWLGELRVCLPRRWQQRLQRAARRVTLRSEAGRIALGLQEGTAITPLGEVAAAGDSAVVQGQVENLLQRHELHQAPRFLLLDDSRVLRKELRLPLATEPNLREVLGFEMDRQTPFRANEVYFDWRKLRESRESAEIHLELLVVPRAVVDTATGTLADCGLHVGGVDVVTGGRALGVNLLPPERRVVTVNPRARLNLALAGLAVVLLVVVMAQSLHVRAARVAALEAAIAEVQDEARRVQRLREQTRETSEAASFLTRKRAQRPMAIEVLAAATRTLPDDTFLDRLVIGADGVQLQGKSRNAQQLIEIVNRSELFEEAAFRGSTRLDSGSGLEIFEIGAAVTPPGDG